MGRDQDGLPQGPAQAAEPPVVTVVVSGLTGSGKSAICGEIEIALKAIGVPVEWQGGDSEKRMSHADWQHDLELYEPRVVIVEKNIPRAPAGDQAAVEPLVKEIERILDEESAWIARPNAEVTNRIALRAGIAMLALFDKLRAEEAALPAEGAATIAAADPLSATSPIPEKEGLPQPMAGAAEILEQVANGQMLEGFRQKIGCAVARIIWDEHWDDLDEHAQGDAMRAAENVLLAFRDALPEKPSGGIAAASSTPTTAREGGNGE